jgi:Raf kinase inhibitor-like YbhB/YbcL family protein
MKKILIGLLLAQASFANEGPTFILSSPSFDDGATLPLKQVSNSGECKGKNSSPALEWTDGPNGTQGYAVTVFDPDMESGSGWWHWTLFNIPKDVTSLREAMTVIPKGSVQGRTDGGKFKFEGPCHTSKGKPHRYIFTVYALKVPSIPLKSDASGAMVGYYIHQNMIAKSSITASF